MPTSSVTAPDLPALPAEDQARAELYRLLAAVLCAPPDNRLLSGLRTIRGDASPIGECLRQLAARAQQLGPAAVDAEFTALFVGLGRGELVPYGSFYLTGFLQEKPLAALRLALEALGIAPSPDRAEPEDHIATVMEVMAGLIDGDFSAPVDLATQYRFFSAHVGPWAGRFFTDLERSAHADLYRPVGRLGRLLMDIEYQAFSMA